MSTFDLCVANREAGSPGATSYSTINWHLSGTYGGAYQFDAGTWAEAGGTRYSQTADQATPAQQTAIFNAFEPGRAGRWPNTVPPCGG